MRAPVTLPPKGYNCVSMKDGSVSHLVCTGRYCSFKAVLVAFEKVVLGVLHFYFLCYKNRQEPYVNILLKSSARYVVSDRK